VHKPKAAVAVGVAIPGHHFPEYSVGLFNAELVFVGVDLPQDTVSFAGGIEAVVVEWLNGEVAGGCTPLAPNDGGNSEVAIVWCFLVLDDWPQNT